MKRIGMNDIKDILRQRYGLGLTRDRIAAATRDESRGRGRMVRCGQQGRAGAANRALEILRAMMNRAEEWGLRERCSNPCPGIARNPRNNVARFLDANELALLGRALDAHEARWPEAVAAIRLLALTGCSRSEVLNLRWRDLARMPSISRTPKPARAPCRSARPRWH